MVNKNFNRTLGEVIDHIKERYLCLAGVSTTDEQYIIHVDKLLYDDKQLVGKDINLGIVVIPISSIEFIAGLSFEVFVDELGVPSYDDFWEEVKYRRTLSNTFNRIRTRRKNYEMV